MLKKIILVSLFIAVTVLPAYALDGAKLLAQVDRNLNPESYETYRKLINVEPAVGQTEKIWPFHVLKGGRKQRKEVVHEDLFKLIDNIVNQPRVEFGAHKNFLAANGAI